MAARTTARAVTDWSPAHVALALIAGAELQGDWGRMAAIRLVVAHKTWLHRTAFRTYIEDDGDGCAWLDLHSLAGQIDDSVLTRASSSETAILRLACSLNGYGPDRYTEPLIRKRWTLQSILYPLDRTNAALATEAVRYAAFGPTSGGAR